MKTPAIDAIVTNHHCHLCNGFLPSIAERLIGICESCILPRSVIDEEAVSAVCDGVAFSLICLECDTDAPQTLAQAAVQGWRAISHDDGPSYNFLGKCPECIALEDRFELKAGA